MLDPKDPFFASAIQRMIEDTIDGSSLAVRVRQLQGGGGGGGGTVEPWHVVGAAGEPAFQNSFAQYGSGFSPVSFLKDPQGFVHLRGLMTTPATWSGAAFTLPVGYRPLLSELYVAISNNAMGRFDVQPTGNVLIQGPSTASTWISLSGMTFRGEQ